METKDKKTTRILYKTIAVLCIIALGVLFLGNHHLPSRTLRYLTENTDMPASDTSDSSLTSEVDDDDESRLPGDVLPKAYDLTIATNLSTLTFDGQVEITVGCQRSTQQIVLHAKDLNIFSTNVSLANSGKQVKIQNIKTNPTFDHYIIELEKTLRKHKEYVIKMKYEANISKTLDGFYKSYYTTALGEQRPLVVTHFQPTSARKAFPCFDEPAMKATFTLHISRDPTHQSLSNMPRENQEDKAADLMVDHYRPSPPMSTYLLSFMVLDFDYQETETASGVRVCIYAPPEDKSCLGFALDVASKTLSFYEKLIGVPYPLRKLDLVALPDSLTEGVEEWGLINMRREFLVYDEKHVGAAAKKHVMETITRAIAHMWFGDLVGIKWWDSTWLKEGFASFLSYLACYNIDKETDWLTLSVIGNWQKALNMDSEKNVLPLIHDAKTTDDIQKYIFDDINYSKGSMIVKMLMNTMGKTSFLKGIRMFIEKSKYGSVDTSDLWSSLTQAGKHVDIPRLMKLWVEQRSFPIVTLKRMSGPEKDIILAKQESFLEHKSSVKPDNKETKAYENKTADQMENIENAYGQLSTSPWHIPLTYTIQSTAFKEYTVWLDKKWEKLSVLDSKGWIKGNVRAGGYYIVNYDQQNWIKLIKQLKNYHVVFSPSDRAGLIHDAFVLACEGLLDSSIALKLILYMRNEEHYVPMTMLRQKSKCLEELYTDEKTKNLYKEYLWYLQQHLVDKLGTEDNGGLLEQLHRYDTLSYAVQYKPDLKQKFVDIFQELRENKNLRVWPKGLTPNIRKLALKHGSNTSNTKDWEYLWRVYETSFYDSDRTFIRDILATFTRKDLLKKNLQNSIDLWKVRSQDSVAWLNSLYLENPSEDIWEFMKDNWKTLKDRYGTKTQLTDLLQNVVKCLNTTRHLDEVQQFLDSEGSDLMDPTLYRGTLKGIEDNFKGHSATTTNKIDVKKATKWLHRYMKKVKKTALI